MGSYLSTPARGSGCQGCIANEAAQAAQPGPPQANGAMPGPPEAVVKDDAASHKPAVPGPPLTEDETPTKPLDRQPCAMCDAPSTLRCSKCSAQWYCARACQQADWPVHKILCASRKAFETPPGPQWRRAIHFSENHRKVEFVWVLVERKTEDEGGVTASWEHPILDPYFGPLSSPRRGFVKSSEVYANVLRGGRQLDGGAAIFHRDDFLGDGYSKLNQGVLHATYGHAGHQWGGPVVVMKQEPRTSPWKMDLDFVHVDMRDFRDIVDHFIAYPAYIMFYNQHQARQNY